MDSPHCQSAQVYRHRQNPKSRVLFHCRNCKAISKNNKMAIFHSRNRIFSRITHNSFIIQPLSSYLIVTLFGYRYQKKSDDGLYICKTLVRRVLIGG
ncbi:IS1 family transposase [Pectobacterium brasiliense]|uniref:IS1 family transposase n=1 Tax=Pectobacterium brasiliense TaxID=180957 RepID=UPI0035B55110